MKQAEGVVEGLRTNLLAIGAGMAGALSFGAGKEILDWIRGAAETIDSARVLADRVAMSSEAFGKLSYAAGAAGVDQETFAASLEQMNRRLGELAVEGSGPAVAALKRFGLDARQLAEMGTEQAFQRLVGLLGGIGNPAERAAVAMDLFGRGGQALINLAEKGPEGLQELGIDAEKLGVATSNIDAEKVRQAEHAYGQIRTAFQGLGRAIAIEISPTLTFIAEKLTSLIKPPGISAVQEAIRNWMVRPFYILENLQTSIAASVVEAVSRVFGYLSAFAKALREDYRLGLLVGASGFGIAGMLVGVSMHLFLVAHPDDPRVFLLALPVAPWAMAAQELTTGLPKSETMAETRDRLHAIAVEAMDAVEKQMHDVEDAYKKKAEEDAKLRAAWLAAGPLSPLMPKAAAAGHTAREFAGAFTLGSHEAYSAVLSSRAQFAGEDHGHATARNTGDALESHRKKSSLLRRIASAAEQGGGHLNLVG
jgi:hypothetical protein